MVLGGNDSSDALGTRQSIQLIFGGTTDDNSTVPTYLNNDGSSLLAIPEDTAMYFHADVIALRYDGSGTGSDGDYRGFTENGIIRNLAGSLSISRTRTSIVTSGTTTNWRPTAAVSGTNFVMNVRGATNVDVLWTSNIKFTQIKLP